MKESDFNEYLELSGNDKEGKLTQHLEIIHKRIKILNIDDDNLETYKDYLINPFILNDHLNTIRLFKTDGYIESKCLIQDTKNYKVRNLDSTYTKIRLLRQLEKKFMINFLDVQYQMKDNIELLDSEWNSIKRTFRFNTKDKPTDYDSFKIIYIQMIKSICGKSFINSKKCKESINKEIIRFVRYEINKDYLQENIGLYKFQNHALNGFNDNLYKLLNIDKPIITEAKNELGNNIQFIDF